MYSVLLQPAYFFVSSIFPLLSGKSVDKRKLFKISLVILGIILVVALPFIYGTAPAMVAILAGKGYEVSATVLRILLGAMVFAYINHLIGFSLISKNGQKEMLVLGISSLVVNILGNLYAIPRFGIMGAAVVTVITEAWSCLVVGRALWKRTKP
jgi:O-antigen/teichoic acid export membrane protein